MEEKMQYRMKEELKERDETIVSQRKEIEKLKMQMGETSELRIESREIVQTITHYRNEIAALRRHLR